MPKRKQKDVTEMTTDELARHVFPKKVVDKLKRIAHEKDEPEKQPESSSQEDSNT